MGGALRARQFSRFTPAFGRAVRALPRGVYGTAEAVPLKQELCLSKIFHLVPQLGGFSG